MCVGCHGIYVSSMGGETNQPMYLCRLHAWGIMASMFPPCVGRQGNICIHATPMCGVSQHICFPHVWGDKSTYAFMPPPCVRYHGIYVSSMSWETNQHMHLCHLHGGVSRHLCFLYVWGYISTYSSMPPPCAGYHSIHCSSLLSRQINICIHAASMGSRHLCVFAEETNHYMH